MNNYYKVSIAAGEEKQELLIAVLSENGYDAFEQSEETLLAFITEEAFSRESLDRLAEEYAFRWASKQIAKQNWNHLWESNFEPVSVDDFVGIRASFHPPFAGVTHEIVITPKMSFGTGHHATTFMMMQLMRNLGFAGKDVYDFGTGTGILAILAEKLGAAQIVATDNDDWCIENAAENLLINQCTHIEIQKIDILFFSTQFDIIIANINKHIILENITILAAGLRKGGTLLLSGLLKEDEKDIHAACQQAGLQQVTRLEKAGWIALRYF